ncbi:MAG: hypothetical protein DRO13_00845 [Thermoprotei archaeon]|nr:MAG: hypothetical protein DRO13_00845 [Thermoprotei archaeon]
MVASSKFSIILWKPVVLPLISTGKTFVSIDDVAGHSSELLTASRQTAKLAIHALYKPRCLGVARIICEREGDSAPATRASSSLVVPLRARNKAASIPTPV